LIQFANVVQISLRDHELKEKQHWSKQLLQKHIESKKTAIKHIESGKAKKEFESDYENFLKNTKSKSMEVNTVRNRTFENLIESGINLTKVVRIENSNYTYSYFGKTGDFTPEAIRSVIKQGEEDASDVLK
jgi:hypothetical protein